MYLRIAMLQKTTRMTMHWMRGSGRHLVLACILVMFLAIEADVRSTFAQDRGTGAASSQQGEHQVYLPAVIDEPLPTSFELIERALERGEIDEETALTYKVFAAFGDERLPEQYKGDDTEVFETNIGVEVMERWDTLSKETQETVGPFMVQPIYEGSWWHLRQTRSTANNNGDDEEVPPCLPHKKCTLNFGNWEYIGSEHVKVWYVKDLAARDRPRAELMLTAMEEKIWPTLTAYMGRQPLPDDTYAETDDKPIPNNGGDARLDIHVMPVYKSLGAVVPYIEESCSHIPSFILMRSGESNKTKSTLAHEFMHTLQLSYKIKEDACRDYYWWREASAMWAEYYVYDDLDVYQDEASDYLDRPDRPLTFVNQKAEYGAYLWPFYLDNQHSRDLIRKIWENADAYSSLKATETTLYTETIDANPEDRVLEPWPEFVLYNWNREPVEKYKEWDQLTDGAKPIKHTVSLDGERDAEFVLLQNDRKNGLQDEELPPLSSTYYHFDTFGDDARSVLFANGFSFTLNRETVNLIPDTPIEGEIFTYESLSEDEKKGRHVWLLTKIGGEWQEPLDVTDRPGTTWCRDMPAERIEKLVVIFSNGRWEEGEKVGPPNLAPRLWVSNMGCGGWALRDTISPDLVADPGFESIFESASLENITFARLDAAVDGTTTGEENEATTAVSPVAPIGYEYELTSGTVNFDINGQYETQQSICNVTGGGSGSLAAGSVHNNLVTTNYVLGGDAYRGIILQGFLPSDYMPVSEICYDKETGEQVSSDEWGYPGLYSAVWPGDADAGVSETGTVLAGESVWRGAFSEGSGNWRFEAQWAE